MIDRRGNQLGEVLVCLIGDVGYYGMTLDRTQLPSVRHKLGQTDPVLICAGLGIKQPKEVERAVHAVDDQLVGHCGTQGHCLH